MKPKHDYFNDPRITGDHGLMSVQEEILTAHVIPIN